MWKICLIVNGVCGVPGSPHRVHVVIWHSELLSMIHATLLNASALVDRQKKKRKVKEEQELSESKEWYEGKFQAREGRHRHHQDGRV